LPALPSRPFAAVGTHENVAVEGVRERIHLADRR
jgi:hypothetical protein